MSHKFIVYSARLILVIKQNIFKRNFTAQLASVLFLFKKRIFQFFARKKAHQNALKCNQSKTIIQ